MGSNDFHFKLLTSVLPAIQLLRNPWRYTN